MGFLIDTRSHQIGLAADDGGRNDQVDRPQQLDKRLDLVPHPQKLDAAGEEELGERRGSPPARRAGCPAGTRCSTAWPASPSRVFDETRRSQGMP